MINISNHVDVKSTKQDITYIYIHRDEKNLYTVATDSYRLACIAYPINDALYNMIQDGFYTPKYFSILCKELDSKKKNIDNKIIAINAFNATKSTLELNYPEYQQLIKQYQEDKRLDKVQHGIIGKYKAKYLSEFLKLSSNLKDFNAKSYTNYRIGELDITADITSRYYGKSNKSLMFQKEDSYILLMPLNN